MTKIYWYVVLALVRDYADLMIDDIGKVLLYGITKHIQ